MKVFRLLLCCSLSALLLFSCSKSGEEFDSDYTLYRDYITAFSSGIISTKDPIKVSLTNPVSGWQQGQELDRAYYSISPDAEGKVVYMENNTIAFKPKGKLKQDTEYRVTLHLSKFTGVPNLLADFNFRVKTLKQDFLVQTQDLQSYSRDVQYLNATLMASDYLQPAIAKKLIKAEQQGKQLPIRFDNVAGDATMFNFIIDSIQRLPQNSEVIISWDGNPYDIKSKGSQKFEIPGKDNFKVVSIETAYDDNSTLLINFSDPVKKGQDFSGLIAVESIDNLKYAVEGNLLKVFFTDAPSGSFQIEVFQGIESTEGFKTKETYSQNVTFEQLKPEIRFLKSGTILPSSNNLKINFQAVNLAAVDVTVYRIFENNVLQFLQDNNIGDSYSMRDVSLPVARTKIVLNKNKLTNYGKWNSFALDLSKIIEPEPGAIYHIQMSMRKSYSLYKCGADDADKTSDENEGEDYEQDDDFTEYHDYGYYPYDYDWRERDNPCSSSFFYNRSIETNVLASDLGVIAKKGENNSFFFAVSSITSTNPVAGANVALYNYQQQKLIEGQTDNEGTLTLSSDKKPYFAVVSKGKSKTYIKIADGYSQSVSNFDVDGTKLQKGLKGYIYGERGVWRPGDTLFIGFILNDKLSQLPASHPVKLLLSDPKGKMAYHAVQKRNDNNHYKFVVPTAQEAPTGNWEAMVSVGGAHFYKSIKIETIKPNRLKIKNSFAGQTLYASEKNTGTVEVTWLHGAIAKNLKVEMQAKFFKQKTAFKGYTNYVFDDVAQHFGTQEINIFSGQVDDNGKAQVTLEPKLEVQAPGMLNVAIITKAYEKGGDVSTDVVTASYSPYKAYAGLKVPEGNKYGMLETGKSNRFDVVSVDDKGKPKASRKLDVRVYKVDWRWWWSSGPDDLSEYSYGTSTTPYYATTVVTNGSSKGSFTFKADENDWGRYLIRVTDQESGHSAGETVLIDYPYWSANNRKGEGEEASMLMFTSDKQKYAVGEKAEISFPSSAGGRALISLENGSGVVKTYWAQTQKGETKVQIPVTAEMAPNVYIYITLLQPHANTKNDSPIRLYGILPIEVIDKSTLLQPQIAMADVLKPEQKTSIKVSEKSGRAMTYTLAIVDDGLLDLTRFKTPNAWDSFFAKEALGVKTFDVYDEVIGAYGGKVNQAFSIGGDADLGGGKAKKANRFKPVVIYMGPYTLGKGQTKTHQIKLPKYVGSVRTMVVAANTNDNAYGSAEKTTPVRSPLMVLASLPRKVSPGEKVTLPVTVFAMEDHVKNVTVSVKTNNGFRIAGEDKTNVKFSRPDEKVAYFDLEAGSATGIGKVTVTAISGAEKATYEVELDVMNPNPVTVNYKEMVLQANSNGTIAWESFGVPGTNKAKVEVSSFPSIDFNRRLDYLIRYPHGCVEQTTSGAFPQLYLADIADVDESRKKSIQRNVTAAIERLSRFQLPDGGFSYWPGETDADDWGTSYAGHFYTEAEKKGYVLPPNAKKQWIQYQKRQARQWRFSPDYHNDFAQAYRLYTLALAGSPDLSLMNRLRETGGISNESKLRLAAAYALAGQKSAGEKLLANTVIDDYNQQYRYYYYGSADRNRAMALETLLLLNQKEKAFKEAIKLAKDMSSDMWMSTQTTAYCLYSISKFAKINGQKGINVSFTNKGKNQNIQTQKAFADRELQIGEKNSIALQNKNDAALYVKVVYSGVLPVGQEQTAERGLKTNIVFKDRAGKTIDPGSLAQGTEFVAEVTVTNTKGEFVDNVALTQIVPSGWEIVNTRFTDFGSFAENKADYIDIRDDRTNFYFSLKGRESKTFRILLNASYPGSYYLPGVQCEAMYDNSFLSRTKGRWVKVEKQL
ncbi:alpha-2-macroglobulin family protein [Flavobacterium rhizosphaerae]|uniref:MG2 domain-containing protein n=1 Tax=Flavobacterium rhizosphaerae TaxID=3163298 RepID=A0ABW8YWH7_9FLAO